MPHIYKTEKKNSLNTDSPLFIGTDNICTQIRSTLGFAGEGRGGGFTQFRMLCRL